MIMRVKDGLTLAAMLKSPALGSVIFIPHLAGARARESKGIGLDCGPATEGRWLGIVHIFAVLC